MDAVTVLYASAAVLLVIAGAAKVARPATTAALMEMLGAVLRGSVPGTLLARARACRDHARNRHPVDRRGGVSCCCRRPLRRVRPGGWRAISVGATSCGCFGRVGAPPTSLNVFGNLVLAVCSFGSFAGRSPLEVMEDQPAAGIGFVAAVGVLAGLELVVFTALPEVLEARKSARVTRS